MHGVCVGCRDWRAPIASVNGRPHRFCELGRRFLHRWNAHCFRIIRSKGPVWNNETGESMLQMEGHTLCINAVAFSTDGMRIASGASDKTVGV